MSEQPDGRRRLQKDPNADVEAEHSMTSERDQLTVEQRERERDRVSRAKQPTREPEDIFDPEWARENRRQDRGPGEP